MESLYHRNGLVFWSQEEIRIRHMLENHFVANLSAALKSENRAFEIIQCEAPLLTPYSLINQQYTNADVYRVLDDPNATVTQEHILRPETTMGSYAYAEWLLTTHKGVRLPICVWQHGKSFRKEQDQPLTKMRLKEFYQLEFQNLYSPSTKNDYSVPILTTVQNMIAQMIGPCRIEDSDRLPDYAEWTKDIVADATNMEVCSISKRKDFKDTCNIEVAIGTDRCVHHFLTK